MAKGNLLCNVCKTRPAIKDDILCRECHEIYATLLHNAKEKTSTANARMARSEEQPIAYTRNNQLRTPGRSRSIGLVGSLLLSLGLLALAASIFYSSTILVFIGLGLAFWGSLMFFVRPQNYVRSDLLNATAVSSLKTIDKMMLGMGYREKGVYIPTDGPDRVVVFVPSESFSIIPEAAAIEGKTSLTDPAGLLVVPPGLALSQLIEKKLGFELSNCGIETITKVLPKVLTEDLEIVRDIGVEVKGDRVEIKLVDSIYADSCREVRDTSRRCGLGCPMCSALACVLAIASGKPILFEEDKQSPDKRTTVSSYQLLNQPRLQ